MADTQNINAVTALQSIDANDSILVSDGNTSLAKIDYNKLAKSIIEQYTGSTLAGSGQSIQSAFNALNSNMSNLTMSSAKTVSDLNTLTTAGFYYVNGVTTNRPADASYWYIAVFSASGSFTKQFAIMVNTAEKNIYHRVYNGTAWSSWDLLPTRNEIDTLNSNKYGLSYSGMVSLNNNDDLNNYTTPGSFYSAGSSMTATLSHCPFNNSGFSLHIETVAGGSGQYIIQTIKRISDIADIWTRTYNGSTWTDWEQKPYRSEITALNSKTAKTLTFASGLEVTLQENYLFGNGLKQIAVQLHSTDDIPVGTNICTLPVDMRQAGNSFKPVFILDTNSTTIYTAYMLNEITLKKAIPSGSYLSILIVYY